MTERNHPRQDGEPPMTKIDQEGYCTDEAEARAEELEAKLAKAAKARVEELEAKRAKEAEALKRIERYDIHAPTHDRATLTKMEKTDDQD